MLLKSVFILGFSWIFAYFFIFYFIIEKLAPKVEKDDYFGSGQPRADQLGIQNFEIVVEKLKIESFKNHWKNFNLPSDLEGIHFQIGTNPKFLASLNESIQKFDWKQHEHFLNTFKHFKTEIEGIEIHFLRHNFDTKKNQQKIPILLIHGFGSSFWDFYKVVPILANPARFGYDFGSDGKQIVFDVVVPSIPGFGFSAPSKKPGLGAIQTARIFGKLMDRLEHNKYFIHGSGALGCQIGSSLALLRNSNVLGLHFANPFINFDWISTLKWRLMKLMNSDFPKQIFKNPDNFEILPDSIGIGLESSSIALTAFLADKWVRGINHPGWHSDSQGGLHAHNTVDEFLTEVFIYWISGPIHGLRFLHFTKTDLATNLFDQSTLKLPIGILTTPRIPYFFPKYFYEQRFWNIVHFFEAEKGGEFVAIEIPDILAKEIFAFVEQIQFK